MREVEFDDQNKSALQALWRHHETYARQLNLRRPSIFDQPKKKTKLVLSTRGTWTFVHEWAPTIRIEPEFERLLPHQKILHAVAEVTGVTVGEMKGPRRHPHIVRARQIAMWFIRNHSPHLSYPKIGQLLGGKDHTTIMRSVQVIDEDKARFSDVIKAVEARL
ncbi:helix-turn-helix domain-containing protein [Rhodoligotrophos ferricapiens]|uniref:helix-turn-helix domain-containing protein n=1 Tax=Rhodoligotrophos ferricapiens TaxID=3069264 RepID=UPI00315CFE06